LEELRELGMAVSNRFKTHAIQLAAAPEEILRSFDRTCVRQRISRAEKSGIRLRTAKEEHDLKEFYRLYLMTRRRLGLPPQPFRFIRLLWDQFAPQGGLVIRLAEIDDQAVAGIMLLKFRDRVSAEYMVSDEAYRGMNPSHLLFWDAIQEAKAGGCTVFDFGRTDERNARLMDFKGRWGTVLRDLPVYHRRLNGSRSIGLSRDSSATLVLRAFCRKSPLSILEKVGNLCYRHLG
jgi:lipid II:glycine glycyltransferase (peptidoglycan interpeptide bridge formation enzyme)